MEKNLTIEDIKKAVEKIAPEYGLTKVSLFGSRARGNFRKDSDVDLIVEFDEKKIVTLFDLSGIMIDLEEIFGLKVDVVTRKGLERSYLEVNEEVEIFAA